MTTPRAWPASPRLHPPTLTDLEVGDPGELQAHEAFERQRYANAALDGRDLMEASFSECSFTDVSAHETDLRTARIVDSVFERLTAPVLLARRSHWREVGILRSRLGSVELYDAGWQSVHLVGCKIGYLNLRGAEVRDVLFTDCTIDELDLGGARATRVSFAGTRLASLDTTGATLVDVDLRAVPLQRIVGIDGLRGATLTPFQIGELAPVLAERLGIRVRD